MFINNIKKVPKTMEVYEVFACLGLIVFFALPTIYIYYVTLKPSEARRKYEERKRKLEAITERINFKEKLICEKLLEANIFRHIKGAIALSLLEALEDLQQISKRIDADQNEFDQNVSRIMMKLEDKSLEHSSVSNVNKPTPNLKKRNTKPILINNVSVFSGNTDQPQLKSCSLGLMSPSEKKQETISVSNVNKPTPNLKSRKTKPSSVYNVSVFSGKTEQPQLKSCCLGLMSPSEQKQEAILNAHYNRIRATLSVNKLKRPSKYNLRCENISDSAMQTLPVQFNYENRPKFKHGRKLHSGSHNINTVSAHADKNNKQQLKYDQENSATNGFRECKLNYSMLIDFLQKKNGSPKVIVEDKNNMSLLKLSEEYNDNITLLRNIEFKIPPHMRKLRLQVPIKTRVSNLVLRLSISLTLGKNGKPKLILKSKPVYRKKSFHKCQSLVRKIDVTDSNTLKKINPIKHSLYTNCNLNRPKYIENFEEEINSYDMLPQLEKGDCKTIAGPEEKSILMCLNDTTEKNNNAKHTLQRYINLSKTCSTTDLHKSLPQQCQTFIHTSMLAVIEEESSEDSFRCFDEDDVQQENENYNWNVNEFTAKSTELCVPSTIETKTINKSPFSNFQIQCSNVQVLYKQWENKEDEVESSVLENIQKMAEIKTMTLTSLIDAFNSTELIDRPISAGPSFKNCTDLTVENNTDNNFSFSKNIIQLYFNDQMNHSDSENNLSTEDFKNTENTLTEIKAAEDYIIMSREGPKVMTKQLICARASEINYDRGENSESDSKPMVVMKSRLFRAIDQFDID